MQSHTKRTIALRYFLAGAGWHHAVTAMEFARGIHDGLRKDGITPEFSHQVSIANYAITLMVPIYSALSHSTHYAGILHPETTLAAVFLHDVREDAGISHDEIVDLFTRQRPDEETLIFAQRTADAVECLTKKFRGSVKTKSAYFDAIAACPVASIVKGADRIHNFQSMNAPCSDGTPVFSLEKQQSYIQEGRDFFLPMLKTAQRHFPSQQAAYENIKHMLLSQIEMLETTHRHWSEPRREQIA